MLSQHKRITTELFKLVAAKGVFYNSPLFSLRVVYTGSRETPRISIVVSKKVAKLAVDRNSIKRRVSSVIHTCYPHILAGTMVAVFPKTNLKDLKPAQIHEALTPLLKKAKVL